MNEDSEWTDPLYSIMVRNYLKNKEIFGDKFMEVRGCEK